MLFQLPEFKPPDFRRPPFDSMSRVITAIAPRDGIAPDNFHATSNHPEYICLGRGKWILVPESRMDCAFVLRGDSVEVVELRRLKKGDAVVLGRSENGEEGVFVHTEGFEWNRHKVPDKFSFRIKGTRENSFSRSYDALYELLRHDREHGYIVWVAGPAVAFDKDSREAMQELIRTGFCHALIAGNALATHDLEAAVFKTGLGRDIYSQYPVRYGHYHHLEVLNMVRGIGSMRGFFRKKGIREGIMHACEEHNVPYVLSGSIRDDGPLPEVIADAYEAQDAMRVHARKATTVIALATQLHSIAFGNMIPSYRIMEDGTVRPVYFHVVDISEFSVDKLANRGSIQTTAVLTNVQDFMVNLWRNLRQSKRG